MDKYELTTVLPGKTTSAKKKSAREFVEKLVKTLKGKVAKIDDWGELPLSYKIKGNESGIFIHFWLELDRQAVSGIDNKLRLEEGIIRHLLVKKESEPKKAKAK